MKAYLFPGQGSQRVGMGEGLFDAFPEITAAADAILGYSIKALCLEDRHRELGKTQFTQPALYVVNALTHRRRARETSEQANFAAGHSLGEYNALEYAGALSFEDGLRLVKKRGELMASAPKGTMAAIIGSTADKVAAILTKGGLTSLDVANYNAPNQVILSGPEADIGSAQAIFEANQAMFVPLNVSGAFHSRYMQEARDAFAAFVAGFSFSAPKVPVIANFSGKPYESGAIAQTLTDQITQPVRWVDGMHYLLEQGVEDFVELGPGDVLTKLAKSIRSKWAPSRAAARRVEHVPASPQSAQEKVAAWNRAHRVGTPVKVKGYGEALTTKTQAVVLFGHRAAVYMEGYNGYFALDEVEPVRGVAVV
jgi:malonyl CoA-acyl carrier protein transacylase